MKNDEKTTIGAQPPKIVYGNDKDHPDNIKPVNDKETTNDPIVEGAKAGNLTQTKK